MEGIQFFLLIAQVIIALLLIVLVLAQKSDGDSLSGLSTSSAGLNSAISGRSTISILSKITMTLIALFMINCLVLASISRQKSIKISQDLDKAIQEHNSSDKSPSTSTGEKTNENISKTPKILVPEVE